MAEDFEWDEEKNRENRDKHGVRFEDAQRAFLDPRRLILPDVQHGQQEERYFCIAQVAERILTVRFTYRGEKIRIFGAAFWRAGRKKYQAYRANKET